jgi:hypothetical protein
MRILDSSASKNWIEACALRISFCADWITCSLRLDASTVRIMALAPSRLRRSDAIFWRSPAILGSDDCGGMLC